jgi:hypothetical protein
MDMRGFYDDFPDHYQVRSGIWDATPAGGTPLTHTLSPRQAAQHAINHYLKKKPATNSFDGGKWVALDDYGVTVIESPCSGLYICFHHDSIRLFRSVTKGSSAITPTTLRTIVDPIRPWLLKLFRSEITGGEDLLAVERGDNSVLERLNAEERARKAKEREDREKKKAAAAKADEAPKQPTKNPATKAQQHMGLIDVETTTNRVILETKIHSVTIDRARFMGLLKSAGADIPKSAEVRLVYEDGSEDDIFSDTLETTLKVQWKVSRETEEKS